MEEYRRILYPLSSSPTNFHKKFQARLKAELGTLSRCPAQVAGTQAIKPLLMAFSGALEGTWIRIRIAASRTQTNTLIQDASATSGSLTHFAVLSSVFFYAYF